MSDGSPVHVVDTLTQLLRQDPVEFDIAILRSTEEGEPFILRDGHLGMHAGDLAWLARDFRRAYRSTRPEFLKQLRADAEADSCSSNIKQEYEAAHDDSLRLAGERLLQITSCLLLVCPDNATAWADRKRAFLVQTTINNVLWEKELQFLNLLMTKHTKAPTSWFHRKYVFQKIVCGTESVNDLMTLTRKEIKLCIHVADRYPKNYYAWTHRIYVLQTLYGRMFLEDDGHDSSTGIAANTSTFINNQLFVSLLEEEWTSIEVWLRTHVSDHSAAHFGGAVLRLLLQIKRKAETAPSLPDDVADSKENDVGGLPIAWKAIFTARCAVEAYPTHEVLWIFRRICSHAFLTHVSAIIFIDREAAKRAIADFWTQEITALVNQQEPMAKDQDKYLIDQTEVRLEAAQSQIFTLSYVVWVLECIVNIGKREKYDFVQWCGMQESEVCSLRLKALRALRALEDIPHNVYRSTSSK